MWTNNENVVEFLTGDKTCTVSFTNRRYCNKIMKMYASHPEVFERFEVNQDGSVYARFPLNCLKFSIPKAVTMTEEQKTAIADRLRSGRGE